MATGQGRGDGGKHAFSEIKEFATFDKGTQRYLRRSIDVAFLRGDAVDRWARDVVEQASIKAQMRVYERLDDVRSAIPDDTGLEPLERFIAPLIAMSAFDLGQGRIGGFVPYRFLYERMLGASSRPWLPSAFCAAAALPSIHPDKRRGLLQSISEGVATAAGWSGREPSFVPEWIEKIESAASESDA